MAPYNIPAQDTHPTSSPSLDTNMIPSMIDGSHPTTDPLPRPSLHNHNNNTSNEPRPPRPSFLPSSSRRTTMAFRNVDHSQPPMEDPNNSPEVNARRRREYERVQQLNHMVETVILDFEHAADNIKSFNSVLDETDQLLDLWTQILSQTQHTKQLLETAVVVAPDASQVPAAAIKKQKAPPAIAPVGTHMTKKRKTG